MAAIGRTDVEISWEEQSKINQFSKLNVRNHELKIEIKALKDHLETLEDAEGEVEMQFDDNVRVIIGDSLVQVSTDYATSLVQKQKVETNAKLDEKKSEFESVKDQMKQLKSHLYAKLGTAINLEED
mmetsp:Transcript_43560/g.50122  ORF Transcript_43560/g.50122 Transcript_43560/m.50122 type:complete len:127 (-) Transcript_43560:197-577(-)|eukprot:CAMPEP_0115024378 /NCGR_PEP_ID=MMETSP0216-20121206/33169_1 /TAXON_ID=223996 /ORGANISM="Protocruzia adherens, Strain Boccale" /LENGTH=126 /DNA_ID=CAMNT_0002398359 /DNA_START=19 /DNA_END=399 /DNA_ORIENTATION=-